MAFDKYALFLDQYHDEQRDVYKRQGERLGGITTDESGKGRLDGIAAGQSGLYLLEETAPKGYAKHTEKIPFEIVSGQTAAVTVTNHPQGDPVTILLKKQDGNTASNTPQGNADLGGAQFTIRYYQGLYQGADELKGKTPERTWIVETDRDGYAALLPQSLVPGSDPLYYASNGTTPTIPLGTVAVSYTHLDVYKRQPYVFGASGPNSFDCSGFVCYVLNHSGVKSMGRTNAQGLYNMCTPVPPSEAKPGDLIFFTGTYSTPNPVTHVAFYVGGDTMLHAGKPVQYSSFRTPYWQKHFYSFGRLN